MLTPEAFEDRRSSQGRLVVLRIAALVAFTAIGASFWVLQVIGNEKYKELAENNHVRTITLRAPRGVFFDRYNKVLVENRYAYSIAIIRERIDNSSSQASRRYQAALAGVIRRLSGVVGVEEQKMADIVKSHQRDPIFRPIDVVEHATDAQVAEVLARKLELPEVVVQEVPVRAYPSGGLGAHMVGYVSEVQAAQMTSSGEYAGLSAGAMVGQAGLEKAYNSRLMGIDGKRDVAVNSAGREVSALGEVAPTDGQRMQLTIDFDLQRALEEGFKANGYSGAGVALDPRTGEILALTSQPEFDPNDFADGIDTAKWAQLRNDALNPLMNRLIQGKYPPGSTFKILMAIAGLSEGVIKPDSVFFCNGGMFFGGRRYECDKHEGHGWLDLRHAIEQSCNVYFYNVGNLLGPDKIHEYADKLGLTGKTGIDLPGEGESNIPSSEWKLKTYNERWYPAETLSVAIGQGYVQVTPLALATMMSTVANGGTVVVPHLVKAVDEGHGWTPVAVPAPRSIMPFRPEFRDPVVDGLWMVVNGEHGTGSNARIKGRDVVGKTGTAQVISKEGKIAAKGKTDMNLGDNSWFVFFAPKDNPTIAGVVFVEHGGHGATAAAPIAGYVLDTFFSKQDGRALPTWPASKTAVKAAPEPVRDR